MLKLARLNEGPEIFHTLQGEGVRAGRPSVFVRLSLCNLHCRWCDTDYTWNWVGTPFPHDKDQEPGYQKYRREEQIVEMEPEEVAAHVMAYPCKHVVITGGEPMLQPAGLVEMMHLLKAADPGYSFEMETNGTVRPDATFDDLAGQYNVSPKLENSGNLKSLRERPEVLNWFASNPKVWFKFVVADVADIEEIEQLVAEHGICKSKVLLMPEGRTPELLEIHRDLVVKLCLEHGYSFSDRLHLRLFGVRRGT